MKENAKQNRVYANTIAREDVVALVDHEPSKILGRQSAKTLELREDETGLFMDVILPDTSTGRDIGVSVERGDVTGQSIGFTTVTDEWSTKDEMPHRVLREVRLYDVSPVTFPAYPDTTVAARALEVRQREAVEPRRTWDADLFARRTRLRELSL